MKIDIKIEDYTYPLPDDRIAKFPLENRDDSKLLVITSGTGFKPMESTFKKIADWLPADSFMVFNDTKVVPARMLFRKPTGATIEVFCLEPVMPLDYEQNFATTSSCQWKAIIGNLKKWKGEKLSLLDAGGDAGVDSIGLEVTLVKNESKTCIVEFSWKGGITFSQVIAICGRIPIPPYLKRDTQSIDLVRYQTAYAIKEGSVAAPTAGLHFTQREFAEIDKKGISRNELCLHVGAGTFLPVKNEYIADHTMHQEPFEVSIGFLRSLRASCNKPVIAVGTTSTRCLESLFYLGVHCIESGEPGVVEQWEPYRDEGFNTTISESLDALISYMEKHNLSRLVSRTRIIIVPGFRFRVIDYLVTNFHQPQSTLLLLIAAFAGDDWRETYRFALDNGFRFLSYGDSSLLQRKKSNNE